MKRLLVILALFLAACTLPAPKQTPPDTLSNRIRYICNSGRPIDVTYQKDRILLRYKEKKPSSGSGYFCRQRQICRRWANLVE